MTSYLRELAIALGLAVIVLATLALGPNRPWTTQCADDMVKP